MALDGQGWGSHDFGLARAVAASTSASATPRRLRIPVTTEPFYQAEAIVPVSPGVTPAEPIRLVSVRREPGSLRVRLLDTDGRPARGTVQTVEFFDQPEFAASTGEQGVAVFRDMPGGSYRLRGFIDRLKAPAPESSPLEATPGGFRAAGTSGGPRHDGRDGARARVDRRAAGPAGRLRSRHVPAAGGAQGGGV